jgi:hypothetical protein
MSPRPTDRLRRPSKARAALRDRITAARAHSLRQPALPRAAARGGMSGRLSPAESGDCARRHDKRVQEEANPTSLRRRNEENDWPIRLMSLIFGQMIMGAATARANGDPQMHKFVAKVTGVLCRAKGVSAGLCQKQADRGLTRLQVRSEERVTDSLEFELFQRLLNERRNFTICCD